MQLKNSKLIVVTIWLVTIAILGMWAYPTSPWSQILIVGVGLVPTFLILRFWNGPAKTMSERINEERG
jgi:hypothetical protein